MAEINIEVTDRSREKFREFLEAEERDAVAVRLAIQGYGPHGFQYELDIVTEEEATDELVVDFGAFKMLVDRASSEHLDGVKIDFVERGLASGFQFDNPNSRWKDPVAQAVQQVLDSEINPGVATHGGFVSLLDVKESTAYIALGGGCQGCGMADVTLKQGIEVAIRNAVPEITEVLDTTDHAAGENPFYQPSKGEGASPFT